MNNVTTRPDRLRANDRQSATAFSERVQEFADCLTHDGVLDQLRLGYTSREARRDILTTLLVDHFPELGDREKGREEVFRGLLP